MEVFKEQCEKSLNEQLESLKGQMNDWHDLELMKSSLKIQKTHITVEDHEKVVQNEIEKIQQVHEQLVAKLQEDC